MDKTILKFKEPGTFESYYAACGWLSAHGYSYGSMSGLKQPVPIMKGEYNIPQKWHNLTKEDKALLVGVMESNDFREGEVIITIY
jgi:hypothetical protein